MVPISKICATLGPQTPLSTGAVIWDLRELALAMIAQLVFKALICWALYRRRQHAW